MRGAWIRSRAPFYYLQIRWMMPYERFDAWRACHELTVLTYRVTQQFPRHELYGLTSQMRRAAFSSAANIAEGSAKRGNAELRRFLDMSLGSLSELRYTALLAKHLELLTETDWEDFEKKVDSAGKLTMGLYKAVASKAARPSR
jgi:four helix bundle protein